MRELKEGETVISEFENIQLMTQQNNLLSEMGNLMVTSKRIIWNSWELDFSDVVLHALNRGSAQDRSEEGMEFEVPCIYMQVDGKGLGDKEGEDIEDEDIVQELRFIPQDSSKRKFFSLYFHF
jgi:hypothetical protein